MMTPLSAKGRRAPGSSVGIPNKIEMLASEMLAWQVGIGLFPYVRKHAAAHGLIADA
jgi:hypothetical protein